MSLDELRDEYAREQIGACWLAELWRAVRVTTVRFDPVIYGRVAHWREGWEDLLQEVVVDRLLREGQLQYIVHTAVDLDHARRLLISQVRRTLARRRDRTVIDNLLDRARDLLGPPGFEAVGSKSTPMYRLAGATAEVRTPSDGELRHAALGVCQLPRVPAAGGERAPRVYTTETLHQALHVVAESLPCTFGVRDLDRIFRQALTDFLPGALDICDEASAWQDRSLTPEEVVVVHDVTERIWTQLSVDDRMVLAMKLQDRSDGEIAMKLGVSRPTAASRKQRLHQQLQTELAELAETVQQAAVDALTSRCRREGAS